MEYTEEILNIAKFMGLQPFKRFNEYSGKYFYYYNNAEMQDYEALPFYVTWSDIMPVVIKIEKLGDNNTLNIFGNHVKIGDKEFIGKTKLDAVIKAVNWWITNNTNN